MSIKMALSDSFRLSHANSKRKMMMVLGRIRMRWPVRVNASDGPYLKP